jgi:hypothetical protein
MVVNAKRIGGMAGPAVSLALGSHQRNVMMNDIETFGAYLITSMNSLSSVAIQ